MWPQPYPDALPEAVADTSLGPEARLRAKGGGLTGVRGRPPAPATATAGGAGGARCAGLASGAGRGHAPEQRSCGQGRPAARPDDAEDAAFSPGPRASAAAMFPSASRSIASPTPSSAKTRTESSRCRATTPGSRWRPSPSTTRATRPSRACSTTAPPRAAYPHGSLPRRPTVSPPLAATSRTPRRRSPLPTGRRCSRQRLIGSPRPPGSATAACSPISGSPEACAGGRVEDEWHQPQHRRVR